MAEEKVITAKDRSKTDVFKEHVQKIIFQSLGVKVSKDKAWALFKNMTHGTTEFVLNLEDKSLPLSGVGTFAILETKPRGSKAGLDKDGNKIDGAKVWPCVPRYRFYPSSVTEKMIEQVYGLEDHGVEVKHYGIYAADEVVVDDGADEIVDEAAEAKAVAEVKADEFDDLI